MNNNNAIEASMIDEMNNFQNILEKVIKSNEEETDNDNEDNN